MKNQDLDRIFRDGLNEKEVSPPADLWGKIERELDSNVPVLPIEKKGGRRRLWIGYTAAASLLLIAGLGYLKWQNLSLSSDDQAIATQKTSTFAEQTEDSFLNENSKLDLKKEEKQITKVTTSVLNRQEETSPRLKPLNGNPSSQESSNNEARNTVKELEELVYASAVPVKKDDLIVTAETNVQKPIYVEVTEVEPIKPLLEGFDEEVDGTMVALEDKKVKGSILSSVKAIVSDNISALTGKDVSISTDDEGSLRIDLGNSIVRNRNKKRK